MSVVVTSKVSHPELNTQGSPGKGGTRGLHILLILTTSPWNCDAHHLTCWVAASHVLTLGVIVCAVHLCFHCVCILSYCAGQTHHDKLPVAKCSYRPAGQ